MSADFTPEKEDLKILTPFKMQVLTNFPYIEADFDALTNYQLLCKVVEYLNKVITNENEVTEQVTSLYNAYVSLQNYVNTYFDNLDLQPIVDNKLDEMAESGELADMIAEYIKMQGQLVYNSVEEMKEAENIQNGSFLKTYGYYTYKDGGAAFYKARTITNQDVIDDMTIIALKDETLVAELIPDSNLNLLQLGINEELDDCSTIFNTAISLIDKFNITIITIPKGKYYIDKQIILENINNITIDNHGIIHANSQTDNSNCFNLINCNNLEINNINIESTRDKTEPPPADHTRITTLGSNIYGFRLEHCSNITFNNAIFNSLQMDITCKMVDGDTEHTQINKNIYINGWISNNGSMPMYSSDLDNLKVTNAKLTPAIELGNGDHCIYLGPYTSNFEISNSILTAPDLNLGQLLSLSQGNYPTVYAAAPKNMFIHDIVATGVTFIDISHDTLAIIDNVEFTGIENTLTSRVLTSYKESNLIVKNSSFKNLHNKLFEQGNACTLTIDNCEIDYAVTDKTLINVPNNNNENGPTISIKNSLLKLKNALLFSGGSAQCNVNIINNHIICKNYFSYLTSNRSNYGIVRVINNLVTGNNQENIRYFSSNDNSTAINTYLYNNILYNVTNLIYSPYVAYNVNINNYINDTLVT